jgi:hypothetical protein
LKAGDLHQPALLADLFLSLTLFALQGFGGVLAAGAFLAG